MSEWILEIVGFTDDGKDKLIRLDADKLRFHREAQGVTREDLAAWAGISIERLFDIEAGRELRTELKTARLLVAGVTGRREI